MKHKAIKIITLIAVAVAVVCCRTIRYVEVPQVTHDTIQIYNTKVDSIRFYDSISVKGVNDTIYIEKYRYKDRYHFVRDSVYLSKVDTITKVHVQEIEKKLTKWQGFKMNFGGWSFGILLALVVGGLVYLYMKLKL